MRHLATPKRRGFRIIDLVMALAVLICFLMLFLPRIGTKPDGGGGDIGEAANRAASQNNLKQMTLAAINNADQNHGDMAGVYTNTDYGTGSGGTTGSVFYVIMPQMDNDLVFKAGMTKPNTYNSMKGKVPTMAVKTLFAPGDPTADKDKPWTSYVANNQAFYSWDVTGAMVANTSPNRFPGGLADGPSRTLAFAEAHAQTASGARLWHDPNSPISADGNALFEDAPEKLKANAKLAQSYYKSGINVSMFDGSARAVKPSVSAATWKAAFTPAANDMLGADW